RVCKVLSTPADPSLAIAQGLEAFPHTAEYDLVHGTTVATNALLERRGARVVLVTTAGFEDVLFLGRQQRPDLYAFHIQRPSPLLPAEDVFGVGARVDHAGCILRPLTEDMLDALSAWVGQRAPDAVAICLLHAYVSDEHERRIAARVSRDHPGVFVTYSAGVARRMREFERASTVALNAYVGPVMSRYLRRLHERVQPRTLEIFESSGTRASIEQARRVPARTVLSGPAGGVIGALRAGADVGRPHVLTFDMGGTSTDVSLCDGQAKLASDASIGGLPLLVPTLDVHTVGAGGGSIAYLDDGGALRVGPRSAGAAPGPAAYGLGGVEPTVTDAHVVLGRLRPDAFLGGAISLDLDAARRALGRLTRPLSMSVEEVAAGILDVADAAMERALKVISLERGFDPRDFTLVSFGGAGGLHACRLARALEVCTVLVPRHPGLLSAWGMLRAARARDLAQTFVVRAERARSEDVARVRDQLVARARGMFEESALGFSFSVALRYAGQSFSLKVPVAWGVDSEDVSLPLQAFHERHEELYGWAIAERAVEIVEVYLRAEVLEADIRVEGAQLEALETLEVEESPASARAEVWFGGTARDVPVVARRGLGEGDKVHGPAVVTEYSGTTVLEPGWVAHMERGHLLLRDEP
ncbi:MAG: hydantoinase/oxoprolinase family protein, partial [Myxococcota bacterium]